MRARFAELDSKRGYADAATRTSAFEVEAKALQLDLAALHKKQAIYEALYQKFGTRQASGLSWSARQKEGLISQHTTSLVYGEVAFEPFAMALHKIKHKFGGLGSKSQFYDLGSGTGKPVFAAVLLHGDFESATGIEILGDLHAASVKMLWRWEAVAEAVQQCCSSDGIYSRCDLELERGQLGHSATAGTADAKEEEIIEALRVRLVELRSAHQHQHSADAAATGLLTTKVPSSVYL